MAYISMKKLITNENNKYNSGTIIVDEYNLWKANTTKKLDVFYACNRLTDVQYEELIGMFLTVE